MHCCCVIIDDLLPVIKALNTKNMVSKGTSEDEVLYEQNSICLCRKTTQLHPSATVRAI